jgi:hypothetical protein
MTTDHHSAYLAKTVAALTPEGRKRADELLDELVRSAPGRDWIYRFARAREAEVDLNRTDVSPRPDPGVEFTKEELDDLIAGFMEIRNEEPLDDVSDWANAVVQLLEDDAAARANPRS